THGSLSPLDAGRNVDRLAVCQGDDGFLDVLAGAKFLTETLYLALADEGVDRLDLDREQGLDGFLDLGLGGVGRDVEDDLAVFGRHGRLFGDDRVTDHVVVRVLAHANRASSASSAALVRTSLERRRMSTTLIP